jgi:hypothetical protein
MRKRNQEKISILDCNNFLKSLHSSIVMTKNSTRTIFRFISEIISAQFDQ